MTLKAKIKKKASPSDSEFTNMLRLAKESDSKALEEICLYFAPLINGIAVGLSEKGVCFHYPFDDLIQEGNIGLFDAIKKAQDIDNIGHFVGYAKMRIYGQMMDALRTYSNTDRFINKGCSLYRKISKKLEVVLQREPRLYEIRDAMPEMFKNYFEEIRQVASGKYIQSATLVEGDSLFEYISGDLSDDIVCNTLIQIIEHMVFGEEKLLSEREKSLIKLRYFSEPPLTQKEVGKIFSIGEVRVCQLEAVARKKIRDCLVS